jgi:hypothetical protein
MIRLQRDPNNNAAVLNTDKEALNKYKMERRYYRRVNKLENDILEIKETVIKICERIDALEKK